MDKVGDEKKAMELYHKAANQDQPDAQYNLGVCYLNGTGVKRDRAQAVYWCSEAADQGHEDAAIVVTA